MPKGFLKIDLEKGAELKEKAGAEMEIETSSLHITRLEGTQLDINSTGKTVVKTEHGKKAKNLFSKILPTLAKK